MTTNTTTLGMQEDAPQAPSTCPSCAAGAGQGEQYVYAIGRIEPRFPSIDVEKEFRQATGRSDTAGLTDRQALHGVLSQRQNRYLARNLCWVLTIEGIDAYILQPADPADYELLLEALRPSPRATDVDVVIGTLGPMAPPSVCNGLTVPIVVFDQIYSFDIDALLKSIPRPESIAEDKFGAAAEELFARISQLADNTGIAGEHRAVNYLSVRYPAIYAAAAEAFGRNASLTSVEVRPSHLGGAYEVVFSFTDRATDFTEKFFARVNASGRFPFLVTKLSPFYDR